MRDRRAFSLLEVVTVIAIIAISASVAVPIFYSMIARARLRSTTREVIGAIAEARMVARSGREGMTGWDTDDRVQQAGIRLADAQTLEIFVDADEDTGNQNDIVLTTLNIDSHYQITMSQSELRFQRNGTLSSETDVVVIVEHSDAEMSFEIQVAYGGRSRMERRL